MKTLLKKAFIAGMFAFGALGVTAANADQRHNKPAFCDLDHDHRSHQANYYDHYSHDRYYRAGPYRDSGVSFSITLGNDRYDRHGRHDRYDRYDRRHRYNGRRNGYRGRDARRVNREVFDTRYRARIVLTEDVIHTRRGPRLVCNVTARGPEARYVSDRRMRRIADRNCSRRARINVYS